MRAIAALLAVSLLLPGCITTRRDDPPRHRTTHGR